MDTDNRDALCQLSLIKPPQHFTCGSLPVSLDAGNLECLLLESCSFTTLMHDSRVALPGFKVLPAMTNLHDAPILKNKVLPDSIDPKKINLSHFYSKKCEALAISGLAGYGDEVDIIAPVEVLKQIFKTPYTKSGLSITAHRVGRTLVLNQSTDLEVCHTKGRRSSSKELGQNLFSKFVQQSVLEPSADAKVDEDELRQNCPHVVFATETGVISSSPSSYGDSHATLGKKSDCNSSASPREVGELGCTVQEQFLEPGSSISLGSPPPDRRLLQEGAEASRGSVGEDDDRTEGSESGSETRAPVEGFLRILLWQFEHIRMLLGSDLLLFSNKKHSAVSLHLLSVTQEFSALKWLDIWLDNVMASVPEVAVCYHLNGVVKGYELLKTDEILLLKGVSEDGSTFFHPHVVQKNASLVLRFLLEQCSKDPGKYLLHRSSGKDNLQLFDLTPLSSQEREKEPQEVSPREAGRARRGEKQGLSLSMLLYRLARRLSQTDDARSHRKSARFFAQCLELLEEESHPGVRACAHERVARLLLEGFNQLSFSGKQKLLESATNSLPRSVAEPSSGIQREGIQEASPRLEIEEKKESEAQSNALLLESPVDGRGGASWQAEEVEVSSLRDGADPLSLSQSAEKPSGDPAASRSSTVSAKLQAVHHISQAIRSMRVQRHMLESGEEYLRQQGLILSDCSEQNGLCVCGEPDCLPLNRIAAQEDLQGDRKLVGLVLLLGEAYLALAEAFKEGKLVGKALRATELACIVCGAVSAPSAAQKQVEGEQRRVGSEGGNEEERILLFWGRLWCFLGDVYVDFHRTVEQAEVALQTLQRDAAVSEEVCLRGDVVKEVKRLRKKQGRNRESCAACSEQSCSCLSDRRSSGSSASSSASPWGGAEAEPAGARDRRKAQVRREQSTQAPKAEGQGKTAKQRQRKGRMKKKSSEGGTTCDPGGSLLCFGRPITADWETNLRAAGEHYAAAAVSFSELKQKVSGGAYGSMWQEASRKQGWAYNELGRRLLAAGSLVMAEDWLTKARDAFQESRDVVNVVLISCNLGHGKRSAAEKLVARVPPPPPILSDQDLGLEKRNQSRVRSLLCAEDKEKERSGQEERKVLLSVARKLYSEALEYYRAAKNALSSDAEEAEERRGLQNEVLAQFGHTYLRLGMLESVEEVHEKLLSPCAPVSVDSSPIASFTKALALYESMGESRRQEAAFAHHQVACLHKNNVFLMVKGMVESGRHEPPQWHQMRRFVSLAEFHWNKALDVYRAESHADMFLEIWMHRCDLCLASGVNTKNKSLFNGLNALLEGRKVGDLNGGEPVLSDDVKVAFVKKLQKLLRELLSVHLLLVKKTADNSAVQVERFKSLYKMSLVEPLNLKDLHLYLDTHV